VGRLLAYDNPDGVLNALSICLKNDCEHIVRGCAEIPLVRGRKGEAWERDGELWMIRGRRMRGKPLMEEIAVSVDDIRLR
jgi:hypothetical protein